MGIVSTFTALPPAAQNYDQRFYTVDFKADYVSDGEKWHPLNNNSVAIAWNKASLALCGKRLRAVFEHKAKGTYRVQYHDGGSYYLSI